MPPPAPKLRDEHSKIKDDESVLRLLRKFSITPRSDDWIRSIHPSVLVRIIKEDKRSAISIIEPLLNYGLLFYEQDKDNPNTMRARISDAAQMEFINLRLTNNPHWEKITLKIACGTVGRARRSFDTVQFNRLTEFHLYDAFSEFDLKSFLGAVKSEKFRLLDVCGTLLTEPFSKAIASITPRLSALKIAYRNWDKRTNGGIYHIIAQFPRSQLRTLHILLPRHVALSKEESSRLLSSLKHGVLTVNNLIIEVAEEFPNTDLIPQICSSFNRPENKQKIRNKFPGAGLQL